MKKIIFVFFLLFGIFKMSYSQTDTAGISKLQSYVNNMQVFNRLIPQEKVYLHFDNTGYTLGEDIWFSAYIVSSSDHQPTKQSGVLYVELLNSKGKVLETKKLKIEEGRCHSHFYLSPLNVEYFPGFYEVRAYTKGMLNFGRDVVFSRVFPVFQEYKKDGDYKNKDLEENLDIELPRFREKFPELRVVNVSFYPEGGNLVKGLQSIVAFKVVDKNGRPLEVDGEVVDSEGVVLTKFSTRHAGMGSFLYFPDGNKNKVRINYNNRKYTYDLPKIFSKGYVMTVNTRPPKDIILQIEKTPDMPDKILGLSIHCRGEVVFFNTVKWKSPVYQLKIPKEVLPAGVNQIVLFDEKGEIFSERLAFISPRNEDNVFVKVVNNKEEYQPLEKVSIDFIVEGEKIPSDTRFSLAVRDAETMAGNISKENIASYFLLSSDLQGYIEDPDYYFQSSDPGRLDALDLLMLIQGWKRYEWQSMAGVKPFKIDFEPEKQLTIKGFIKDNSGKNVEIKGRLLNEDKTQEMEATTVTDNNGYFYYYPEDCFGEWYLSLRSPVVKNADKAIRLDRWFSPKPRYYETGELFWSSTKRVIKDDSVNLTPKDLVLETDSVHRNLLLAEVEIERKREKDLYHHVGKEIDRLIDTGEKIPSLVHDYLSWYDTNYKGKLTIDREDNGMLDEDNASEPSFPSEIAWLRDAVGDTPQFKKKNEIRSVNDKNSNPVILTFGEQVEAQEIRSNIKIQNISYLDNNGSFMYKEPHSALFFHLFDGKWNVYVEKPLRSGRRIYDITLQQYTARRQVEEVKQIIISQKMMKDQVGNYFTPIFIYPFRDFSLRRVPGVRYTTFDGYSYPKSFFTSGQYREDSLPDTYEHNRTLYWNPDLKIDASGKTTIEFYNNLTCRKLDISLEGITSKGIPLLKAEN